MRRIENLSDGANLWLVDTADAAATPGDPSKLLSADEMERANRFYRAEDRMRFILTRAALRELLGAATGLSPEKIAFRTGPYGKPYLADEPGLHFNVSHSGSMALIGIADRPVGVDIEAMRENIDEFELARAFFCDEEHRFLGRLEGAARLQAFYKIWTCKEAVLKAFGVGISTYLRDFSVTLTMQGFDIHAKPRCFTASLATVRVQPVAVPGGYAAAYALA